MQKQIHLAMKRNKPVLIFLIGFMGSGKTTVGKLMANQLGYEFVDTDSSISQQMNKSITEIFHELGEQGFRKLEHEWLLRLNEFTENTVIATGGGMPCHQYRLNRMLRNGKVVYLKIDVKSILKRIDQSKDNRPLLQGLSLDKKTKKVTRLLKKRRKYYEQAHVVISSLEAKKIDYKALLK